MESFGRISLFPGLPLASSKFFGFLDLNLFSVSDGGFCGFHGMLGQWFLGCWIRFGSSGFGYQAFRMFRILDLRFQECLDFSGFSKVLGVGFSGIRWMRFLILDRTFGFFGLDRFSCCYKDVKYKSRKEVFSTKLLICPTNEKNTRRTSCQVGNFGEVFLQDVQTDGEVLFVPFSDGYLIAKYIDSISSYIVNFINVNDIGAMDFQKGLSD